MDISGQSIVISGGVGSIGCEMIARLTDSGASKLHVFDINESGLKKLAQSNEAIIVHVCDVSEPSAVNAAMSKVFSGEVKPNILINNAGKIHSELFLNLLDREDKMHGIKAWQDTLSVNLDSVFYMTRAFVSQLQENREKGVIVNLSSISAGGNLGQLAYSVAKSGVNALTVTLGKELGALGIRVGAVAPGFFDSQSLNNSLSAESIQNWRRKTPLRRLGNYDEIYQAIQFIIENEFFNGKVIELDGGLTL